MKKKIIAALMFCMALCPSAYARGYGAANMPSPSHYSSHVAEHRKPHHPKPRPTHSHQYAAESGVIAGVVTLAIVGVAGIISLFTNGSQN